MNLIRNRLDEHLQRGVDSLCKDAINSLANETGCNRFMLNGDLARLARRLNENHVTREQLLRLSNAHDAAGLRDAASGLPLDLIEALLQFLVTYGPAALLLLRLVMLFV